jgi:hypothetical protein
LLRRCWLSEDLAAEHHSGVCCQDRRIQKLGRYAEGFVDCNASYVLLGYFTAALGFINLGWRNSCRDSDSAE